VLGGSQFGGCVFGSCCSGGIEGRDSTGEVAVG